MNEKKYLTLCAKSISGDLTREEEKIFNDWLSESDQNRKEYDAIKSLWNLTETETTMPASDIDTDWGLLNQRLLNEAKQKPEFGAVKYLKDSIGYIFSSKLRPISVTIILAFVFILSWMIFSKAEIKPVLISALTSAQEHKSITLPDGSLVVLNNNSKLDYKNIFADNIREVYLYGEGYFSVKKDGRPFVIKTSNAKTTVLGTKFNIWTRDERTRVSVNEGKVKVADEKNADAVYLIRNQQSTVVKDSRPSKPLNVDSDFIVEWLDNKLVFSNSPINEVVEELEGYYSTNIKIAGKNLNGYNLTGSFKNRDVDSVLSMICLALDVSYTKNKEGYVIKLRN